MSWTYNTPEGTPTNGPMIASVAISFTGFALILVCLRLYVRGFLIKAIGYDDWVIVIAWLGACGYTSASVYQTKWGLGLTSLDDMPPENEITFGKVQYAGAPFYVLGIWGFKMSLLLSYLRFMAEKRIRMAVIGTIVVITLAHIAFLGVFLFLCIPVEKQWNPDLPGKCGQGVPFYLTFSALTLIFDVVVMILPFPTLLRSQIQRRKKTVLLALFGLGLFVTIIQVVRIQTIRSLENYLDSAKSITWSIIETSIGIVIACVPTLAPLMKYFHDRTSRYYGRTSGRGSRKTGEGGGINADGGISAGGGISGSGGGGMSRRPGSHYALGTWRSGKSGIQHLGSGIDRHEVEISGPMDDDQESTDNILAPMGIVKTTDVRVTTEVSSDHDGMARAV